MDVIIANIATFFSKAITAIIAIISIIIHTKYIAITLGVLTKLDSRNISRNKRGRFSCFSVFPRVIEEERAVEGTEGP
jgi:hypothetical protein